MGDIMVVIYVVTRNSSCYTEHDFSTAAVEMDDLDAALRRISTSMFDDYSLEHYMRSKRLYALRDWSPDGKRRVTWDDQWARYTGVAHFTIEQWAPGADRPAKSWSVEFDRWFKRRILERGWSDSDTKAHWDKVRGDIDTIRQCIEPQTFKVPELSHAERQAWVTSYGNQGLEPPESWSDSDSSCQDT